MISVKLLPSYFGAVETKICSSFKRSTTFQRLYSSTKFRIDIMSDIENKLESGSLKHRKHPGVRKMPPIILPPSILDAIYRLVSTNHESTFLKRSHELVNKIFSRRLPVEMADIQTCIQATEIELSELDENVPDLVKKKRILDLKKRLEREIGHWKHIEYTGPESTSYLAGRAAPNYASTYRVFTEIQSKIEDFQPKTFFDFGSGIGSAVWAANSLWGNSIKEYFCVDSSPDMNELSQSILTIEGTEEMSIKPITYRQFLPASETLKYDLVVSAFSLLELSSMKERLQVIDTLWRKTKDVLVVIELGTLAGFRTVLDARDYVLHIENNASKDFALSHTSGAHVVCPCPHDQSCPMAKKYDDTPCGLKVTYQTIFPRQRQLFKNDWISYVVLRKSHRSQDDITWPRIVRPVLKKSRHVHCRVCCEDGKLHEIIVTKAKHGKHPYRSVRASSLGDLLPANIKTETNEVHFPDELFYDNFDLESDDENKE